MFPFVISIIPEHALTSILHTTPLPAPKNLGIATSDRHTDVSQGVGISALDSALDWLDIWVPFRIPFLFLILSSRSRPTAVSDDSRPSARRDDTQRSEPVCSLGEYLQSLDKQLKTRVFNEMIRHCTHDPILLIIGPSHRA